MKKWLLIPHMTCIIVYVLIIEYSFYIIMFF